MSFVGLKKDVVCGFAYYAEESLLFFLIKTFIIYTFFMRTHKLDLNNKFEGGQRK